MRWYENLLGQALKVGQSPTQDDFVPEPYEYVTVLDVTKVHNFDRSSDIVPELDFNVNHFPGASPTVMQARLRSKGKKLT